MGFQGKLATVIVILLACATSSQAAISRRLPLAALAAVTLASPFAAIRTRAHLEGVRAEEARIAERAHGEPRKIIRLGIDRQEIDQAFGWFKNARRTDTIPFIIERLDPLKASFYGDEGQTLRELKELRAEADRLADGKKTATNHWLSAGVRELARLADEGVIIPASSTVLRVLAIGLEEGHAELLALDRADADRFNAAVAPYDLLVEITENGRMLLTPKDLTTLSDRARLKREFHHVEESWAELQKHLP